MRISKSNLIKIAIAFILLIGVVFSLNFIKVGTTQTQTQSTNNGSMFEHLYLDASADSEFKASNVSENFGTLVLRDFDVETETNFYIVIAFVNFSSGSPDWTQSEIDNVMLYFNDDDPNNDIYSVYEYMYDQSYGKIRMRAGYVTDTTSYSYSALNNLDTSANSQQAYYMETSIYSQAVMDNEVTIDGQQISYFHCRLLYFPCDSNDRGTSLWPHAWMNQAIIVSPKVVNGDEGPFTGVYCHELTHVLGVPDLYPNSGTYEPVGEWYLMGSTNYYYPQTINAYYKSLLGFVEESYMYDNLDTRVEQISSDGIYTLSPATSSSGTIALKFGERNTQIFNYETRTYEPAVESFYIEYKKKSNTASSADYYIPDTGIIIYRVVESESMLENGNLYPSATSCQYQVYVLRPTSDIFNNGIYSADNAAIGVNESFGNLYFNSNAITYSDGINSQVVVTNLGTDAQGNIQVQVDFASDRYVASGTLSYDGATASNVQIYTQSYNNFINEYTAPSPTSYYTDEYGYFFVTGLTDNTILLFVKDGEIISQLQINGGNLLDVNIEEYDSQDVQLNFYSNINGVEQALANVNIYVNNTSVGASDESGNATLTLEVGDVLTFELDGYTFSTLTYSDYDIKNYRILGIVQLMGQTIQLNITTQSGDSVDSVEIYDVTDSESIVLMPSVKTGNYFEVQAYEGMVVRVVSPGLAINEFTVQATDFGFTKDLVLYEYQNLSLRIVARNNSNYNVNVPDMSVYVDGKFFGMTNALGEIQLTGVYNGQVISFLHDLYQVDDYTVSYESTSTTLQAVYKEVSVSIQFLRPQVEGDTTYSSENNIIPIEEIVDKFTVFVDGVAIQNSVTNGMLYLQASFYSTLTFNSQDYAITDSQGIILIENNTPDSAHQYGVFTVDPSVAVSYENGQVVFSLYAKKYLTISGQITFPEGQDPEVVSIYLNDTTQPITTSKTDGTFEITVIEGDKLDFRCDGYEFESFYAMDTLDLDNFTIEAVPEDPTSYIGLYILFGILALMLIIPLFIRLRPKKKYLDTIEEMQNEEKEKQAKMAEKEKKEKEKNKDKDKKSW